MKWTPLLPARIIHNEAHLKGIKRDWRRMFPEMSEADMDKAIAEEAAKPCWKNLTYQVTVDSITPCGKADDGTTVNIVHLSIKRLDRKPTRDWRELQRIKNQLLGPECEAVELFPAESRLVDTANQFHLWGFDNPAAGFPFGWKQGRVVDSHPDPESGAQQRPLDETA